jgi:hypothetical protein
MLEGFCFPAFFCLFLRDHILHVFHLCFVPVLFSFVIFVSLRVCLSPYSFFVVSLFCSTFRSRSKVGNMFV